jgi:hypothetical protein
MEEDASRLVRLAKTSIKSLVIVLVALIPT